MIALTLSLLLNFTYATENCDGDGALFFEGQCYTQVTKSECQLDANKVVLNNNCYELKSQNSCDSEFSLNVGEDMCVDTASFSTPDEVFQPKSNYKIKVQLVPKNINFGFQQELQPNGYLDRIFSTHDYTDLLNADNNNFHYTLSAPLSISPSDFRLYDEEIVPNIFASVQSSIEKQQSLRFEIEQSDKGKLIQDSKLNLARALESIFTKYGRDMQNYNIYVGVTQTDQSSNNTSSFAGVGLPLNNGEFEIKVFSNEKPKDDNTQSTTLESQTGVELSLLNIHSGSYVLDVYGNIHQVEENPIDEDLASNPDLKSKKGWVLGTRVKPSKNLDVAVEVGESQIDSKEESSPLATESKSDEDEDDLQLKLSISYVFSTR